MNSHKAHAQDLPLLMVVIDWLVMLRSCCFAIIIQIGFLGVPMVTKERRLGAKIITFDARFT